MAPYAQAKLVDSFVLAGCTRRLSGSCVEWPNHGGPVLLLLLPVLHPLVALGNALQRL